MRAIRIQRLNVTVPNFAEQMWVQLWFWGGLGSGSTPSPSTNIISLLLQDQPPSLFIGCRLIWHLWALPGASTIASDLKGPPAEAVNVFVTFLPEP